MPKFNYVAMDSRGKETKGTLEVANQNEAISRLKEMGYFPTKVVEADKSKDKADKKAKAAATDTKGRKKGGFNLNIRIPGLGGKVKPKVLTTFTRQLATLVDAGDLSPHAGRGKGSRFLLRQQIAQGDAEPRRRAHQLPGVGVLRFGEDIGRQGGFDHAALFHH